MSNKRIESDIVGYIKNYDRVKTINYCRVPIYTTATLKNVTSDDLLNTKAIFISPIKKCSCLKCIRLYCNYAINFVSIFKLYTFDGHEVSTISKYNSEKDGIINTIELNNRANSWLTVDGLGHLSNQSIAEYISSLHLENNIDISSNDFMIGMCIDNESMGFWPKFNDVNLIFQVETVENNISNAYAC